VPLILAFSGKLGSGKDTAADRLSALSIAPNRRISFAKKLKESAAALFGIDPAEWEWMKNDPNAYLRFVHVPPGVAGDGSSSLIAELTAREFLQRYGTEAHRDVFGENFWTDQAFKEYDTFVSPTTLLWLATDCRFENEAKAIKNRGGLIYKVIGVDEETGTHVSEAGLPEHYFDGEIRNTIRDDNFANLDNELRALALTRHIPVTPWV